MAQNVYRTCPDCRRRIAESCFEQASAHAPGCSKRRSVLAKDAHVAREAKRVKREAAAERRRQARGVGA